MSSGWSWPLTRLRVTDEFGYRIHPIYGDRRLHRGIDLAASANDPVYAAAVGTVSWAGYNGGEGNSVHVDHPDGSRTKYFHNTSLLVSLGQRVAQRQQHARAGTTGASTGVHVHFETHTSSRFDSPVDPRDFMAERGAPFGSSSAAGGNATPIEEDILPNMTEEELGALILKKSTQGVFDAFYNAKNIDQPKNLIDLVRAQVEDAIAKAPQLSEPGELFQAIVGRIDRIIGPAVRGQFIGFRVEGTSKQFAVSIAGGFIRELVGDDRQKLVDLGFLQKTIPGDWGEEVVPRSVFDWVIASANQTRVDQGLAPIAVTV